MKQIMSKEDIDAVESNEDGIEEFGDEYEFMKDSTFGARPRFGNRFSIAPANGFEKERS